MELQSRQLSHAVILMSGLIKSEGRKKDLAYTEALVDVMGEAATSSSGAPNGCPPPTPSQLTSSTGRPAGPPQYGGISAPMQGESPAVSGVQLHLQGGQDVSSCLVQLGGY